ncbi:MAG: SRPBCC family protein [Myxococcota bacterium]|jgi:hypothetical protein|nr:SRPBCC family protein [Myxococcota bacterium]
MAVVTTDILLTGIRRDAVFDWLGQAQHHEGLLQGAFSGIQVHGPGDFELTIDSPGRSRTFRYRLTGNDNSHGGRRVLVETTGKRFGGHLHYSLRTMRPSTNTLVTLHMDYEPGKFVGALLTSALNESLEKGFNKVLENLSRQVPRG